VKFIHDKAENKRSNRKIHEPDTHWFTSSNKSKVLYHNAKWKASLVSRKELSHIAIFDDQLNLLWSKDCILGNERSTLIETTLVSNDGEHVYLLARKYKSIGFPNHKNDSFEYVIYDVTQEGIKETKVSLNEIQMASKCTILLKQDEIVLVGVYSDRKKPYLTKGHFVSSINLQSQENNFDIFPFEGHYWSSNKSSKKDKIKEQHANRFFIDGLRILDNGNITYIIDYNIIIPGRSSYGVSMKNIMKNMYNVVLDSDGKLLEFKKIPRDVMLRRPSFIHVGSSLDFSYTSSGKCYLVYPDFDVNEEKESSYKYRMAVFDKDGFLIDNSFIFSIRELGHDFVRLKAIASEDYLLLGGQTNKNYLYGATEVNKYRFGLLKIGD